MKTRVARFRQIVLLIGDAACLLAGLAAALALRFGWPLTQDKIEVHRNPFLIIFGIWFVVFFISGFYNLRRCRNNRDFFTLFFTVFGINALIAVLFFYFVPYFSISPKTLMFLDLVASVVFMMLWRVLFNSLISLPPLHLAVLGDGHEVHELIADLEKHPQEGYKCVLHIKSEVADLAEQLNKKIDVVVVALDYHLSPSLQKSLFECIKLNIQFVDFADFYEKVMQKIPLEAIDRAWFLENINEQSKQFFSLLKRIIDVFSSLLLAAPGLLLFPFIAAAVFIESGSPVIFRQQRVGRKEKSFFIYKFRTMTKENDDSSVTRIGKFLRRSHLDEIPQLWNILKGEMSFVGPRPEQVPIVEEFKKQIPFYVERLLVRPGVTGWAQIYEPRARIHHAMRKLQYDLFYIKHRSVLLDIEIILKTLRTLLE